MHTKVYSPLYKKPRGSCKGEKSGKKEKLQKEIDTSTAITKAVLSTFKRIITFKLSGLQVTLDGDEHVTFDLELGPGDRIADGDGESDQHHGQRVDDDGLLG